MVDIAGFLQCPWEQHNKRKAIGWGSGGAMYADQIDASHRRHASARLFQEVADATGDVDGWIAQFDADRRRIPTIAAGIARRLLAAGRIDEAWVAVEAADAARRTRSSPEWQQVRLDVLDALDRPDEAQAFRWETFNTTLDADHLRAYLKRLPDFEDFDAEQRALGHARGFADVHRALAFLVGWPAHDRAAALVIERSETIDGDLYELLTPAAEALEAKYPLAAAILRRAMIDFTLRKARASRYGHAARHLAECERLARRIDDWRTMPDHDDYLATLRADHGRKAGFWSRVDE